MIAPVYQTLGSALMLVVLLACSAFFSGSETAFFSVTQRQIRQFEASSARLQKLAAGLLRRPGHLLNCLLLGSITVNVLYFASSSVLVLHVGQAWGVGAATALAVATFFIFVLFAEILPKSLTYSDARSLALLFAIPVFLVVQVIGPITAAFRVLVLGPVLRLLFGGAHAQRRITLAEFHALVNLSRQRGLISAGENKLLTEVVELGRLKVRHVMRPRVDMVLAEIAEPATVVRARMLEHHLTKMPAYVRRRDNIVGIVHLRQLFLQGDSPLEQLIQPVHFVPEQKTVESLLEFFRQTGTDTAVVVDEYGGIAGFVRLEDIAGELFGRLETRAHIEPIQQLGPFQYRLAGDLAIHDWAGVLGVDLEETRLSTIGGLVTALLGKIPRKGDVAYIDNLKFTVEQVRRRRIETVILSLEPIQSEG